MALRERETVDPNTNEMEMHSVQDNPHRDAFGETAQEMGEISEFAVTFEGEERTTWFVWLLVLLRHFGFALWSEGILEACACSLMAFMLLGYDTGVISGALVAINGDLGPAVLSDGDRVCLFSVHSASAMYH